MISKEMYMVLSKIPGSPKATDFAELNAKHLYDINHLYDVLKDAYSAHYVAYSDKTAYSDIKLDKFFLTEKGKVAREEYLVQKHSSTKATVALIISGISLIISVAAFIIPLVQ